MRNKLKINIFIVTIFICIFLSVISIGFIGQRVIPVFMEYAVSEIKNISVKIINNTISNELDSFDNNMIEISKNNDNQIQMVDFNSKVVNKILTNLTKRVLSNLEEIENGKKDLAFDKLNISDEIIYEIPLGRITNNIFIGNLGPKIPVKLSIIGDAYSNIKTNVKEYGINNAIVELIVNVTVFERVVMPFISEKVDISVDVPISIRIIQGEIPRYYGGGISKNSSILSIPAE